MDPIVRCALPDRHGTSLNKSQEPPLGNPVERHFAKPSTIDRASAKNVGDPGPRDRFPRIEHEVGAHLPHDRGDTLGNGLRIAVPLQCVDVPPVSVGRFHSGNRITDRPNFAVRTSVPSGQPPGVVLHPLRTTDTPLVPLASLSPPGDLKMGHRPARSSAAANAIMSFIIHIQPPPPISGESLHTGSRPRL